MKKALEILIVGLIFFIVRTTLQARVDATPVVDRGATSTGTITTVSMTTTPVIIVSTGTNVFDDETPFTLFGATTPPTQSFGTYMRSRIYIEFFNDTSTDVYVGYTSAVSTQAGVNYGRRIPPQAAWSHTGTIKEYWGVCSTTTVQKFVITQEK